MARAPRIIPWSEMAGALDSIDCLAEMERAFSQYSNGLSVIPPVGELVFQDPPGDVHIKYGYVRGDEYYVVKIASGFYQNPDQGLPSGDGMMLLFKQSSGEALAILLDEGRLTDIRTAAAGAVAAKLLAPPNPDCIGILGAGTQARLQLEHLQEVIACREVLVWARRPEKAAAYCQDMAKSGFAVTSADSPAEIAAKCQLIVCCTPSTRALLQAGSLRPGTHVTAMGSDTASKQELAAELLGSADLVVADSLPQCRERGEISHALAGAFLSEDRIVELGKIIDGEHPGRESEDQITIADLTGVAVQDLRIAAAVYERLLP